MKRLLNQGRFLCTFARVVSFVCVILAVLLCVGCASHPCKAYLGGQRDLCLLRSHGVPVQRVGQTVRIVLPSDQVFVNDTDQISPRAKPYLQLIARFIRTFSTISVKVAGYSNDLDPPMRTKGGSYEKALVRSQAESVERYLSDQHINARLLYAVGSNGKDPIAWTGTSIDRSLNRRIEITFRFYENNTAWY